MTELTTQRIFPSEIGAYRGYSAVVKQRDIQTIGTLYTRGNCGYLRQSNAHEIRDLKIDQDASVEIICLSHRF